MKIKMRTHYAGPNGSHGPGDVVSFPDEEARELVAGGYAVTFGDIGKVVDPPPPVETTVGLVEPESIQVKQKPKGKKKKWGR